MTAKNIRWLQSFIEDLPIVIFEMKINAQTHITQFKYINNQGKEFFNKILTVEQISNGFKFDDLLKNIEQIEKAENTLQKALHNERVVIKNRQYLVKTLQEKQILVESSLIIFSIEDSILARGSLIEKSEVVKLEIPKSQFDYYKTIEEEVENLKGFFEKFDAIVMILNEEGRIQFISPNVGEDILYRPREEILGRKIEDIFPKGQAQFFKSQFHEALKTEVFNDFEYHLPINNTVRWFQCRMIPIVVKDGKYNQLVAIIRDITKWRIKSL
ncbi:MAG TPA: PAS domain-containing protein [candidate division Zixibacteria bacterium]|nr:PAS domain-containing protein [candidate division Zixibacteria bacterium]